LRLRLFRDNPKTKQNEMTGPAVASLKLLAQATGEYTREELNKVAKLGWTDAAAKQIAEAKAAELGGGGSSTGSETAGDNTQGGSSSTGSDSSTGSETAGGGSGSGSQSGGGDNTQGGGSTDTGGNNQGGNPQNPGGGDGLDQD